MLWRHALGANVHSCLIKAVGLRFLNERVPGWIGSHRIHIRVRSNQRLDRRLAPARDRSISNSRLRAVAISSESRHCRLISRLMLNPWQQLEGSSIGLTTIVFVENPMEDGVGGRHLREECC